MTCNDKPGAQVDLFPYLLIVIVTLFASYFRAAFSREIWFLFYGVLSLIFIIITFFLLRRNGSLFTSALFFILLFISSPLLVLLEGLIHLHFPGIVLLPPLVVYVALVLSFKKLRIHTTWLSIGKIERLTFVLMITMIVISALALFLWTYILKPDISIFLEWIPSWSKPVLILGGIGFALFNALVEELIYRGIFWEGLSSSIRSPTIVLIIQAIVFGLWHYKGFPGGIVGVIMVFVWGIFLGLVRYRSKGILASLVSHFFADFVIFSILYIMLLH